MEVIFQLLDVDYVMLNNSPLIRIIGKTEDGKVATIFKKGFYPYFFVEVKEDKKEKFIDDLKKEFKNLIIRIEEVEKFHSLGFEEKPRKVLKIFLRDPSQVPKVRDWILRKRSVKEVFEADILFKYRFMIDYDLFSLRWYKVIGKSTSTNTVHSSIKIEAEKIEEIKKEDLPKFRILSFDLEVASPTGIPNPKEQPIAIISLAFEPKFRGKRNLVLVSKPVKKFNDKIISFPNEREMLKYFLEIIERFDPDVITGYNINNFDIPFLVERLKQNNLSRYIGRVKDKKITVKKVGATYRTNIVGRLVVDVYELIKEEASKGFLRLKRFGLGDVALKLIGETKVDVAHSEIAKFWNGSEEEIKKLLEYAEKDSILALRILLEKNLLDKYIEISRVSGLLLQDVLDQGESARIETFLLREFRKRNFVMPLKPDEKEILKRKEERETKGLKGALVLEPKTGLHVRNTVYLDFKAMYPSIMISFNICPTTLLKEEKNVEFIESPIGVKFVSKKVREGIFPQILKKLIEERDVVKKQMKKETDKERKRQLDAKQYALKVMANAFYGYTGYIKARLYILDIANAITSFGRYLISQTKKIVEEDPRFQVVYGDTDSVMVLTPTLNVEEAFKFGKELEEKINSRIGHLVKMKIEAVFKTLLILTKKRYAGLVVEKVNDKYEEKIVMKGIETVRRDWCELTSKTLEKVLEILLKEQNIQKAFEYVKGVIEKLQKNEIPLEDLVITKSISKPLNEYKGIQPHIELIKKMKKRGDERIPGVGDRVGFVIIQGPELVSKRAETPEYIKKHNLKVDAQYYIENQILPPLERVFEVIGIRKSQFKGFGRQILLKDVLNGIKKRVIEEKLNEFQAFACVKCGKIYRRIPLDGRCDVCGGEVLFFNSGKYAKVVSLKS